MGFFNVWIRLLLPSGSHATIGNLLEYADASVAHT